MPGKAQQYIQKKCRKADRREAGPPCMQVHGEAGNPERPGSDAWDEPSGSATLGVKEDGTWSATVKRIRAQGGCLGARSR